jgi:hypothetical protein
VSNFAKCGSFLVSFETRLVGAPVRTLGLVVDPLKLSI